MDDVVSHEDDGHRGTFFIEKHGARIAEMTYWRADESRIIIDHTEVDVSLRGQGVARRLLDAAVAWARQNNTKISATCSYVTARYASEPSIGDVVG
jgi:predicted GNAT family acetyltransferase